MDLLASLRRLPADRRVVLHQPETPRYARARQKLRLLIREGEFLGARKDPERADAWLLALWAPPFSGRGDGYYACIRLFMAEDTPTLAVLYCFYDGTEQSPGFRSVEAARAYAESRGFKE